jgi:hypothetical protein
MNKLPLLLAFLWGCTSEENHWFTDTITTGNSEYDSSHLVYDSPLSHLKLKLLKTKAEVAGYLFLEEYQFEESPKDPHQTEIFLTINGTEFAELLYVREGRMKLKLPSEITRKIIFALQEGGEIDIMASGLNATILSNSFETAYAKFSKGKESLNFIKEPF